jgi:hypothetical protein
LSGAVLVLWALLLTGTHFSISAAVGFVSLFGVAIMDGLLMISSFNALRAQGVPLEQAIVQGAGKRVRAVMMTALTAILGLLPAALSTRIGAQTQRPLAIVVGDDHHAVPDALPDAGPLYVLRAPGAAGGVGGPGALICAGQAASSGWPAARSGRRPSASRTC